MYKALNPHAIGVRTSNLSEAIAAARKGGFDGVEFDVREVADLVEQQGAAAVKDMFATAELKPAGWGLPVNCRGSEEQWRQELAALPRLAQAAEAVGCPRTMT